jgi:hypothetical protein
MASNYTVTSHGDLDTIFRAIGTGVRPGPNAAATGIYVGSQDLNARYNGVNGTGLDLISFNTNFYSRDTSKGSLGELRYIFQSAGYN